MTVATREAKKPLGVRVTAEQHRVLTEAAKLEHRSLSSFVVNAALKAAMPLEPKASSTITEEEVAAIVMRAQDAFRSSGDFGRDLVDELFAERRADALRG